MAYNLLTTEPLNTPLAALKRGDSFWRYARTYTPVIGVSEAPYVYLGQINPIAIQVGPSSTIDTYRVWYMPTAAPQDALFQDVSCRAPITTPISYSPQTVTLTGGNTMPPGLYVHLAQYSGSLTESFGGVAANYPMAPRIIPASISQNIDLIVHFKRPDTLPFTRAPLNNAYMAGLSATGDQALYAVRQRTNVAADETIWSIPTYGRNRVNWTLTTSAAMEWEFYGRNYGTASQSRLITSGTTGVATTASYVLSTARFDQCYLKRSATAGAAIATVDFTFEAED